MKVRSAARAAFWCRRWLGLAVRPLNVSSKKATPTPLVPPTSFNVAGTQGLSLTISAKTARWTGATRSFVANSATDLSMNDFCSGVISLAAVGKTPYA